MDSKFKSYIDERGILNVFDKIPQFTIKRLYEITCYKGMWRGKHYHKIGTQIICVVEGKIQVKIIKNDLVELRELTQSEIYVQEPYCRFEFCSIEESSRVIVLCNTEHDQNDYYV